MRYPGRYLASCAARLLGLPFAAWAHNSPSTDLSTLFAYDQSAPVITEIGVEDRDGATIHDITFPSPVNGEPISAYLVVPQGEAPFAAVLYVHWLDESETANRIEFLDEALSMASEGVISLLPNAMWSAEHWFMRRDSAQDFTASVTQVINLRRALDVLLAQPNVDRERVAYVGHDFGGMYGISMSAVEDRVGSYAFISGTARYMDWFNYRTVVTGDEHAAMTEAFSAIDPITIFSRHLPYNLLLQFAEIDQYIDPATYIAEYQAAAPDLRRLATYHDTHAMSTPIVRRDRMDWLRTQLGLS